MDNKSIGLRIEWRRKNLGLTLEHVADEIGVAKSTVQRYEKGSIERIKLPVIEAIARTLDVNTDWLCCKSEDMHRSKAPTPLPEHKNLIKLVGRDGSVVIKELTDDELSAYKTMVGHLPEADDL